MYQRLSYKVFYLQAKSKIDPPDLISNSMNLGTEPIHTRCERGLGSKRPDGNISIHLYPIHDNSVFGPYIGQNVSPDAHAVFGIAVNNCGTEYYGITTRDSMSYVSIMLIRRTILL